MKRSHMACLGGGGEWESVHSHATESAGSTENVTTPAGRGHTEVAQALVRSPTLDHHESRRLRSGDDPTVRIRASAT